jgi:hypothetical protein
MEDLNARVEQRHQELLELLASENDSLYSDTASLVCPISAGACRYVNRRSERLEVFLDRAAGEPYTRSSYY